MIPSIPTTYAGINMRSRLEAKWAAFFDQIGWRWTYEPFQGDGYIPDFMIHGADPLLIEVKPAPSVYAMGQYVEKVAHGLREHWTHDVLIVGLNPIIDVREEGSVVGLLGEFMDEQEGWCFNEGMWSACPGQEVTAPPYGWRMDCNSIGVQHSIQSFRHRPCGHYPGGALVPVYSASWNVAAAWAEATNATQWRAS